VSQEQGTQISNAKFNDISGGVDQPVPRVELLHPAEAQRDREDASECREYGADFFRNIQRAHRE
jgi:hypothetical protein